MSGRLAISKQMSPGYVYSMLMDGNELTEVRAEAQNGTLTGCIYIGKVKNIVKNIRGAFVELGGGQMGYLPIADARHPVFISRAREAKLTEGDELLVQVVKEGTRSKEPMLTTELTLPGRLLVLTFGAKGTGLSKKLSEESKSRLRALVKPLTNGDYGFVVRTNAAEATEQTVVQEAEVLIAQYRHLTAVANHRTCYSCLYRPPAPYIAHIRDSYAGELAQIVTDDEEIYEEVKAYLQEFQPEDAGKLTFYEDALLPMHKLYGLPHKLEQALKPQVWLKSGAYLVIEPTEAMTVIDVNTGKYVSKKSQVQETFLKINLEAAREAARQIRLRNLSGIILVDFINLESPDDIRTLMDFFAACLAKDPVKTNLIDMTPLQLAEITRKKIRKPLREQVGEGRIQLFAKE